MMLMQWINYALCCIVGFFIIYALITLLFTIIGILKLIGIRGLVHRGLRIGPFKAIYYSIYFETTILTLLSLLIPYLIIIFVPSFSFEIILGKPFNWHLGTYGSTLLLIMIPIVLFAGLYIHNTQGMIVTVYTLAFGVILAGIIDGLPLLSYVPPYGAIGIIIYLIAWASSGKLRERKRLGYAVTVVEGFKDTEQILSVVRTIYNEILGRKPKEMKKFIGRYVALADGSIGGIYSYDIEFSFRPILNMFKKIIGIRQNPIFISPYCYFLGDAVPFKDFVKLPHKNKYFIANGEVFEYLKKNKVRCLSIPKKFGKILTLEECGISLETLVVPILPRASDVLNAFFFLFAKIKSKIIIKKINGRNIALIFTYIYAPGSIVPSPSAYILSKLIAKKFGDELKRQTVWIIYKGEFGTKHLSGIAPPPTRMPIAIVPEVVPVEQIVKIGDLYVESEPKEIVQKKKASKLVTLIASAIPTILKILPKII